MTLPPPFWHIYRVVTSSEDDERLAVLEPPSGWDKTTSAAHMTGFIRVQAPSIVIWFAVGLLQAQVPADQLSELDTIAKLLQPFVSTWQPSLWATYAGAALYNSPYTTYIRTEFITKLPDDIALCPICTHGQTGEPSHAIDWRGTSACVVRSWYKKCQITLVGRHVVGVSYAHANNAADDDDVERYCADAWVEFQRFAARCPLVHRSTYYLGPHPPHVEPV
jgi:hypothetical protein